MNLPSRVVADLTQGTIHVPMFEFRHNAAPDQRAPEFQLRDSDFAANGVCVPTAMPRFVAPSPQRNLENLDVRKLSSANFNRWILDFTTEMHHSRYPGWFNQSHLPEPYPEKNIWNFEKIGFSRDVAQSFRYIRRGMYVQKNSSDEHVVLTDQNLSSGKSSLRVFRNGMGVSMETSRDGVVQRDFSVLFSRDNFLRHFNFHHQGTEQELTRSMAMKLIVAAETVFEDQHGFAVDPREDVRINPKDLFPWPVESARLYSQMDPVGLNSRVDGENFVPELVDQARISAKIRGHSQRMVNVNWYNNGLQHYVEVVVHRPHFEGYLVGVGSRDADRSQPVRKNLAGYIEKMRRDNRDFGILPVSYSDLGIKFYAAS